MGDLKVGMAGARRARGFMGAFQAIAETTVTALCDTDEDTLRQTADECGIEQRFSDYETMIERAGLDIVVVATPMPCHVPQSISALERGIHVLSEVTAAVTLDECWQLLETVEASPATYMMAENYLYMKPNVLVKSLVDAGLFGELYFGEGEYIHNVRYLHHDQYGKPTWRYFWQVGRNGCTYPTHSLGPVLNWFNDRVATVSCVGTGVHTDPEHVTEDTVLMLCKLTSGALVKIRLDMLSNRPHCMTYYSLQGTSGCYEAGRGFGDTPKVWFADACENDHKWRSLWDFEAEYMPEMWRNPPEEAERAGHGGGDYFEIRDFVDSVIHGTPPPVDVYRALEWTAPGLLSEESINRGGIPLPVPDFRDPSQRPRRQD